MDLTERTIDSREVFRGRIIRVRQDTVRLPNGKESSREVVEHPGGVGILAIDGEDRVVLVRQYRYAFERVLTEIPAGKRETGEEPFLTAQRELKEEIGAEAGRWTELGALIASPGCYGETLYLYMAEDLTFGETHPDEDEFLEVLRVPFEEAVRQCMDGTLTDAKTVAAVSSPDIHSSTASSKGTRTVSKNSSASGCVSPKVSSQARNRYSVSP